MTPPKIIALCGLMRSGKDTIADHLTEHYNYTHMKIAGTLKTVVGTLFNFTPDQLENDTKDVIDPHWGITPRAAMQFVGTEIMQYEIQRLLPNIGRTFWMKSLIAKIQKAPVDTRFVISDMRFKHEYQYLVDTYSREDVYVIRVTRPGYNVTGASTSHVSEHEFTGIPANLEVINDSTIESLYKKIDSALSQGISCRAGTFG